MERAIEELEFAVGELGLAGIEVGSNVNGVPIGDLRFWPFFEAAQALGAAIFVHPLRPAGMDRLVGPASLEQIVAFPGEIGLAAASIITSGLTTRFPRLRIALSHGGGSIQTLLPRMQFAWERQLALRDAIPVAPGDAARTLYYDDLLYSAVGIRALIDTVGDDRVMIGTDYPFAIMDTDPLRVWRLWGWAIAWRKRCDGEMRRRGWVWIRVFGMPRGLHLSGK